MSFSRASLKRFNEIQGCAPPVGHYDPKGLKTANAAAFNKSQRFQDQKDIGPSPADFDISCCSGINVEGTGKPAVSSTPKKSMSAATSMESLKDKRIKDPEDSALALKARKNEREIKKLLQENVDIRKLLSQREEDHTKLEGRLQHALTERSSLMSQIASLKKTAADANMSNNLLKSKLAAAEGVTKKRDDKVQTELKELQKQLANKEKEVGLIKHDLQSCVSGLLQDLAVIISLTDKLNNKISQLEQSFDEKDVDSTVDNEGKVNKETPALDLSKLINRAREDAKKIKFSLEDLSTTTDRQVDNFKSKLREKHAGTVDKLQQMSSELLQMQEKYESSKLCNEALMEYRNALKTQNQRLIDLVSRLRQDQWMSEDTIRSLKGEVFALSDENKQYEQQTFESYAELAALMERIELMEEREELRSQEVRIRTEENSAMEQATVELKQQKAELQKMTVQLQNETEKLNSELDKSRATVEELQMLVKFKSQMMADQDDRLKMGKERIDDLSDKLNKLQSEMMEAKKLESSLLCDVATQEQKVSELTTALSEAKSKQEADLKQLALCKENLAMVTEELDAAMEDVAKFEAEKEKMQQEHEEHLEREKLDFLQKLDELQHRLSTTEAELENLQEERNSEKLSSTQELSELQSQLTEMNQKLSQLREEKDCLMQSSIEAQNELKDQLAAYETRLSELKIENESDKQKSLQQVDELKNQLAKSETMLCELQEERESLKTSSTKQFEEVQDQLVKAQVELIKLQKEKESEQQSMEERLQELTLVRNQLDKTELDLVMLREEKDSEKKSSDDKIGELQNQLVEKETEVSELRNEQERLNLIYAEKVHELQNQTKKTEDELVELQKEKARESQCWMKKVEDLQGQMARSEQESTELVQLRQERDSCKLTFMQKMGEVLSQLAKTEQDLANEQEGRKNEKSMSSKDIEDLKSQLKKAEHDLAAMREERDRIYNQFEELSEKVAPYMAQIEEFEAERHRLLGQSENAQCELKKLSKDYALILGHQNQRQKIKHVIKLKEENNALKEEVAKLQSLNWKLQRKLESDPTKLRVKRGPLANGSENQTPRH